jgi:acyl dehydratase
MTTVEVWTGTYEELPVGAREESTQLIDGPAIDAFAHAIKSYNPIHMDGDWTRANTQFPDRIAHGVMTVGSMYERSETKLSGKKRAPTFKGCRYVLSWIVTGQIPRSDIPLHQSFRPAY